jgi:MFS transporter, AAHS family, 4-hydroxybenzoate transporter
MSDTTGGIGLMEPQLPAGRRDLGVVMDEAPWSSFQKWLLACFAMVFAVDGLANQSLGVVLPALILDWGVPRADFAPVTAANLIGVAIGSILGGILGDRIGRRWALIGAIFLFGFMTLLCGFTQDPTQLLVVRFFDGLGIGAAIPNGAALISEFSPLRRRGRAIAVGMVFIPIGGILAGTLGALLLGEMGWRSLFYVAGILPIILATAFIFLLPESPSFLLRRGNFDALARLLRRCGIETTDAREFVEPDVGPPKAPWRTLLLPGLRRQTFLLWAGFFTCLMSAYTIFSWVPTLLQTLGFDLSMTSIGITIFHCGGVVGALFAGALLDRKGFRSAHMIIAGAASLLAFGLAVMLGANVLSTFVILPLLLGLGFCMAGLHNTLYTLAASSYPTAARATGVGVASAVGRLGAVLSSFTGVITLDMGGPLLFFLTIAFLAALCGFSGGAMRLSHEKKAAPGRASGSEGSTA